MSDGTVNHDLILENLNQATTALQLDPSNRTHLKDIQFWTAMGVQEGIISVTL